MLYYEIGVNFIGQKTLSEFLQTVKDNNKKVLIFTACGSFYGNVREIEKDDHVKLANVKINSAHYRKLKGAEFFVIFLEHIIAITSTNDTNFMPIIKSEGAYS